MAYPAVTTQRVENAFKRFHLPAEIDDNGDIVIDLDTKIIDAVVEDELLTLQAMPKYVADDLESLRGLWELSFNANFDTPMGKVLMLGDNSRSTAAFRYHYFTRSGLSDEQLVTLIDEFLRVYTQIFEP